MFIDLVSAMDATRLSLIRDSMSSPSQAKIVHRSPRLCNGTAIQKPHSAGSRPTCQISPPSASKKVGMLTRVRLMVDTSPPIIRECYANIFRPKDSATFCISMVQSAVRLDQAMQMFGRSLTPIQWAMDGRHQRERSLCWVAMICSAAIWRVPKLLEPSCHRR
ncbi:unannotated protein [freshwater metagenome]|uniref:Unannotated protein n=2 Tax=freshwater metagenome TaxID=449393 RepID=A0A6J6IIX0_9ZZZZ